MTEKIQAYREALGSASAAHDVYLFALEEAKRTQAQLLTVQDLTERNLTQEDVERIVGETLNEVKQAFGCYWQASNRLVACRAGLA